MPEPDPNPNPNPEPDPKPDPAPDPAPDPKPDPEPDPAPLDPGPAPSPDPTPKAWEAVTELGEGFKEVEEADKTSALALVNGLELTEDQRGKLAGALPQLKADSAKAADEAWKQQQAEWQTAMKADTDFGGDKFDASVVKAKAVLQAHGSKELAEFFRESGAFNHPAVMRFLMGLHSVLPPKPNPVGGGPGTKHESKTLSQQASKLFPKSVGG